MFCPECGRKVEDDARFCPGCGKAMNGAAPEAEAAVPTEPDLPAEEAPAPEPSAPAVPLAPEPAFSTEPPAPAVPEPAIPGPAAPPPGVPEPAYKPYEPPTAIPQPVSYASTSPQPPPEPSVPIEQTPQPAPPTIPYAAPAAPQEPVTPPGQVPPLPPSAPPMGGIPAGPAPAKKTNWGSICLIGCGILLLLSILGGVALYFIGKKAADTLETTNNQVQIWEPDGTTENSDGDGGLGEVIGGIGEAIEGVGEAVSAANVEGFDPASVDAAMLPTFYGFMIALADDDPNAMHQWMSPDFKQEWSPDAWTPAPHIEHLDFRLVDMTTESNGTVVMNIEETIQDNEENAEKTIPWLIHFTPKGSQWFVTHFE
jgi:hypothetical protein